MNFPIIKLYEQELNKLNNTKISFSKKVRYHIYSILLSLFILSAPTLVLINLLIFYDYLALIIYGLVLILNLFFLFKRKFYLEQIDFDLKVNKTVIFLVEAIIMLILTTCCYFVSYIWWR